MDVINPSGVLSSLLDRNPDMRGCSYEGSSTDHVETERVSYTVPANRKAIICSLDMKMHAQAVTSGNTAYCKYSYVPSGEVEVDIACIMKQYNDANDENTYSSNPFSIMSAGGELIFYTQSSASGSLEWQGSAVIIEFDA